MPLQTRVVTETVTEAVCDLCKRDTAEDDAMVGTLEVKAFGARGRASSMQIAFHKACLDKISDTAAKPKPGQPKAARASGNGRRRRSKKPVPRKRTKRKE